jgi:ribonuclease HI
MGISAEAASRAFHELFVDGSAFRDGRDMGAGWVIRRNDGTISEHAQAVMEPHKGSSVLAEITAAQLALLSIPEGSVVTLHSDCMKVVNILQTGERGRERTRAISDAITGLFAAAARHVLTTVYSSDAKNSLMRSAHHLAREGAMEAQQRHMPA